MWCIYIMVILMLHNLMKQLKKTIASIFTLVFSVKMLRKDNKITLLEACWKWIESFYFAIDKVMGAIRNSFRVLFI